MRVIKHFFSGIALSLMFSGLVAAGEPSFSFIEGGALLANDTNGELFNVSGAMGSHIYIAADYAERDEYFGTTNFGSVDIGAHWHIGPSLQLFSSLSFVGAFGEGHADWEEEDLAAVAFGVTAGIRLPVGEKLELMASARAADVVSKVSVGARFYFTKRFAAGLDLTRQYYATHVGLMVRYDFSRR